MADDLLITPGSRKLEIKDTSGNVDAKIETDASGNLLITNAGGDISIGDTSSDVFIGDGTNNVDIVFEQDGEIRGTSGVTLTLGASGSNVRLATDLNLNSNDITNVNDLTITGNLTVNGTTTTVSSVNTTIADSLIELNSGLTGANTKDIGFIFERGSTGNNAAFFWDESSDRFRFITTTNTGSATSIADNISEGTIQAGSFIGNGSQLGSLNASNLSSGTVPSARLNTGSSGNWWAGNVVKVGTDGVMEIGKYIDFHNTDAGTSDFDTRLYSNASGQLTIDGAGRILTTGDEGAGNGLDADTLDSQHGSYYTNASNIGSGTINQARLPEDLGSTRTLSGSVAILKLQETDVTNSPTWWHVADGGNYSIRLNNTGTYPISISTDSDNDLVTLINLGYGVSITGDLTVSGNGFFNGTKLEGDSKEMIRYNDTWLRLNPANEFTAGIYAGTGIFRTDGEFQVGGSGGYFKVTSTGTVTLAGTLDGRDIAADGSKLDGIESGATADQTQSEINALGITATGLSGTPNISVGTISSGVLSVNGGTTNVVATFQSTDSIAGINLQDSAGNVELSASGSTFRVQPSGNTPVFEVNSSGNATFSGTISSDYITADHGILATDIWVNNSQPSTDNAIFSGYGAIGNRGTFYVTNGGGTVQIGNGNTHNANPSATFSTSAVNLGASRVLQMNGTTVINNSRNLVNIGTISAGVFTTNADTGTFSNSIGNFPLVTSTPYDYVAKFESTDSGAAIVIEDNNSTNNGNRVGVSGNTMEFFTDTSKALSLSATNDATFEGNIYFNGSATSNRVISYGTSTQQPSVAFWGEDHASYPGQIHIVARSDNASSSAGEISFWDYTGSSFNRNVTIKKDGHVGIGIDSPTRGPLHVHRAGSEDAQIHLTNGDTGSGSGDGLTIFADTDVQGIWSRENCDFVIASNQVEAFRLHTNQDAEFAAKVGIGTGTPSAMLTAISTADATPAIKAQNTGGINGVIQEWIGDTDSIELKNIAAGDYSLLNTQQSNGLNLYDGTGGVEIVYNGNAVVEVSGSGGMNVASGALQVGGNTAINSSRDFSGRKGTFTSYVVAGDGSGGVSLTHNDGYGNANVTFNHESGVPEQNGNSARIEVNTDANSDAQIIFGLNSSVTSGVAIQPIDAVTIREDSVDFRQYLRHMSDTDTYLQFTADRVRIAAGGTVKFDSNNTYATETYVGTQISNLVDSAPSTLDTLNELAAALGDDANFSTTVTNSIATKLPLAGGTMTGNIAMGTNDITGVDDLTFTGANSTISIPGHSGIEIDITGSTAGNIRANAELYLLSQTSSLSLGASGTNNLLKVTSTETVINDNSTAYNFRVESNNNANMIHVDGTNDRVGIGRDPSTHGFEVQGHADFKSNMTIDGSVGIGETSPDTKLHITSAAPNIRLEDSDTSSYGEFIYNTAAGGLFLRSDENNSAGSSGSNIIFETDGSERMRIDSSGNLLVGKTTTDQNTAGTQISSTTGIRATVDGNVASILNRTSSDGDIVLFRKDGATVGSIGSALGDSSVSTLFIADPGNVGIRFDQASTDDIQPCNSSGGNRDNAINLGSSSNRFKQLHLSDQINMANDHYVFRQFQMDAADNDSVVYIILCRNAANNDVNGTITMDRTSGLRHACSVDILVSAGNSSTPVGTIRAMGVAGSGNPKYTLVKGTHTDSNEYIALKIVNPDSYHETSGAYFTGRIVNSGSNTLTAVADLTSVTDLDFFSNSIHQIGNDGPVLPVTTETGGGAMLYDAAEYGSGTDNAFIVGHTRASNSGSSAIKFIKQNFSGMPGRIEYYISPANTTRSDTSTSQKLFLMEGDGDFHADGDLIAYSTSTGSDRKLKENIRDLEGSLDKTLKLRGVKYDWKDERKANDQLGFIAQEVEEVVPEVVKEVKTLTKEDETHLTVNYPALVPMLVEAIKEQQTIINRLEERLNNLENKGEE